MTARPRAFAPLLVASILVFVSGCTPHEERGDESRPASRAAAGAERSPKQGTGDRTKPGSSRGDAPRIVILGDSLTAGLGLPVEQSYPSLLQQRLNTEGLDFEVVNAGVSGDTSAGGLSRLDWALEGDVKVLVVALGGNDGLRGLPAEQLKANLAAIIEGAGQNGAEGLGPALAALVPLRFRFWNPSVVRVARKARELLNR